MTKRIALVILGVLALYSRQAAATSISFNFESTPATYLGVGARPGALTSLTLSNGGLTMTITRPGSAFDIVENSGTQGGKPAAFGNRSLDPFFAEASLTPFIANFSASISSVSVDFGDYGGDVNDVLTVAAYSGANATGLFLGGQQVTFTGGAFPAFNTLTLSGISGANSLLFIGGTTSFGNSVFYDNITVAADVSAVPEPASLTLLGTGIAAVMARRRKSRTATR